MHRGRLRPVKVSPGYCPTIEDIARVASGAGVEVDPGILKALEEARRAYLAEASRRRVYGSCTGLGGRIDEEGACGPKGEYEVLLEHAAGRGSRAPRELVRAFLFVRLVQLAQGRAPVRPVIAARIADALNAGVEPAIPLWGSVGASGDLAPSAHAFLCIFYGKGETVEGADCGEALESRGLGPVELDVGEALALINNTAWSTALTALAIKRLEEAAAASLRVAGETAALAGANPEHYSAEAAAAKRHHGIRRVAAILSAVRTGGVSKLQAPYSIRCLPQVYGAFYDTLEWVRSVVEAEACSSPENPLVSGGRVYHACNFHAQHVAIAADAAAVAAAALASFVERRIERIMDGRVTGLPDFLSWKGSSVGLMILQYTAASLAAEARALAAPRTVNSIETSLGQEDHVSMAPAAALRLYRLACILEELASIEKAIVDAASVVAGGEPPLKDVTPSRLVSRAAESLGLSGLQGFCG